ncbi:MAG TPA: hypothetical protein VF191_04910 [Cyclobacteriaceae bacterium]
MKTKSTRSWWSPGKQEPPANYFASPVYTPSHQEYFNEGDEFLDDAIRTKDQAFEQVDGTLEVSRLRSQNSYLVDSTKH